LGTASLADNTTMGRLRSLLVGNVFARAGVVVVLALTLAGLAAATSGRADEPGTQQQQRRSEQVEVIDLNEESATPPAKRAERPAEDLSDDELASVERQIRARSSEDAVAPDDGVSPGAPSDEQVRRELRQLRQAKSSPAGPVGRGSGDLIQPTNGQFTSPFGQRWGRLHAGIDVAAPTGTPIHAAAAGRVILMAATGGYGNYTCIDHGRSVTSRSSPHRAVRWWSRAR
jgi:murein DD-endopeptidase MepM/ murein hydrolase activator NlpD